MIKKESEFKERFKTALELRSKKQVDIARATGIDTGSISLYLKGKYEPKSDKVYLIAKALNVDPGWLIGANVPIGGKTKTIDLNRDIYQYTPEEDKVVYLTKDKFKSEISQAVFNKEEGFEVPLIGKVGAGIPKHGTIENWSGEYVVWPSNYRYDGYQYFSLEIDGDSMYPTLSKGDIVLVRVVDEVTPNDYAVISFDDDYGVIKFLEQNEKGIILISENPDKKLYPDQLYDLKEIMKRKIHVVGKVMETRRPLMRRTKLDKKQ